MQAEKDELGAEIKEAMLAGALPECELYRARLQTTRTPTYPVDRFREVYGDAATFEAARIDNRRVKELVGAGDLNGAPLGNVALIMDRHALYLMSNTEEQTVY